VTLVPAAVYTGAGSVLSARHPVVAPGPGWVRLAVAYTGICGTDLHIFHGDMDDRVRAPKVIGHEMSGRIAELGPGVSDWSVGDPVTVMPLDWDGGCPACRAGHYHVCEHLNFIGIDSPGAMQQSWTVPARTLVALPPALSLQYGALVEPTAVAVHDVRRAGVAAGEKVLVVGCGPIGFLISLLATEAGADVVVAEIDPFRRSVALDHGLLAVDPTTEDLGAWLRTWTGGAGVAVAFEVSGAGGGMTAAVDALGVRGRLCLVAIHGRPRPVDLHRFFWRELTLIGARLYQRTDFERAVELIASGIIPAGDLISRIVPLPSAAAAFEALERGGDVMKILIDCADTTATVR
jgi:(R,R)-butanediol dehydrogenase/meso-butanediol dehydrogenase/diacetyl reductase